MIKLGIYGKSKTANLTASGATTNVEKKCSNTR